MDDFFEIAKRIVFCFNLRGNCVTKEIKMMEKKFDNFNFNPMVDRKKLLTQNYLSFCG